MLSPEEELLAIQKMDRGCYSSFEITDKLSREDLKKLRIVHSAHIERAETILPSRDFYKINLNIIAKSYSALGAIEANLNNPRDAAKCFTKAVKLYISVFPDILSWPKTSPDRELIEEWKNWAIKYRHEAAIDYLIDKKVS